MVLKSKFQMYVVLFTAILLAAFFYSLNFSSLALLPLNNSHITYGIYKEGEGDTNSKAGVKIDSSQKIHFTYNLSSKVPEPLTAVYFYKTDSINNLFDVTEFNTLKIHLKADKAKRIPVAFYIDYPGYSTKENIFSYLPFYTEIDYDGEKEYEIALDDFAIPSWWYRIHQKTEQDFPNIDFSRVRFFAVGSCQLIKPDVEDEITIESADFTHNNKNIYFLFLGIALIGYSIFAVLYFLRRKKVFIPYIPNGEAEKNRDKLLLISDYLLNNFSNPELGQMDLQRDLGITAREIGQILKDKMNTSFKVYLNQIRLEEVKRLLSETDLSINDIAYQSGYGSITHFYKVFKTEVGLTPLEFKNEAGKHRK